MAKITGVGNVKRRLGAMGGAVEREVGEALFVGGQVIQGEAQVSITTNSASGNSGGKHQHVPSNPGEPPNNQSGHLRANIEVTQPAPLRVEIASNARYSSALEYGTSKMAARPFMGPAARSKKKQVAALVKLAVDRAIKKV